MHPQQHTCMPKAVVGAAGANRVHAHHSQDVARWCKNDTGDRIFLCRGNGGCGLTKRHRRWWRPARKRACTQVSSPVHSYEGLAGDMSGAGSSTSLRGRRGRRRGRQGGRRRWGGR